MADKLYFAYGSNINLEQMAFRCPEATVVGPVTLENYELLFRGNGRGYGVATIAPKKHRTVYGLLWRISPQDEKNLDMYDGFPQLYDKETVTVKMQNGTELAVMAYIMTREKERLPTMPSFAYYDGIREGFRQNNLPVRALQQALRQTQREVQKLTYILKKKGRDDYER